VNGLLCQGKVKRVKVEKSLEQIGYGNNASGGGIGDFSIQSKMQFTLLLCFTASLGSYSAIWCSNRACTH